MKRYTKRFIFLCNEEIYGELHCLAKEENSSMGWVIRQLIRKAYKKLPESLHVDNQNIRAGGLR